MVVCGFLRNVTNQLGNLDFLLEFTLEATPNNLPLARLQTIHYGRDRTNNIRHGEKNQLFVDEIGIRNLIHVMVEIGSRL